MANVLISVIGPTAVGKTDLAIELARELGTSIISADSRQVYRKMDIGTAKPSEEQLQKVTHYFIDIIDPEREYSAGAFEQEAIKLIQELFQKNKTLIMTGGSGLYLDAVWNGIPDMPSIPVSVRDEVMDDLHRNGLDYLAGELKKKDPEYYDQVDIHNRQRVVRAVEVCRHTGRTYTWYRNQSVATRSFTNLKIGLELPREILYDRINARVDKMIEKGLLDEAKALFELREINALQTVGYAELFDYLEGKTTLDEAVGLIKRNTRRYAKRQMTWFRRYDDIAWFSPDDLEGIVAYTNANLEHA